jgi:hypothetical protein
MLCYFINRLSHDMGNPLWMSLRLGWVSTDAAPKAAPFSSR